MRPLPADKSTSSQRTLQSAGPITPISEQATEAAPVRVKIITPAPAAHSEKSTRTRTDWEASPSEGSRSRRRAVIGAAIALGGLIAIGVMWRQHATATADAAPEPSSAKVPVSPGLDAKAASAAPLVVPSPPSVTSEPSVAPPASAASVTPSAAPKLKPAPLPPRPAVAVPVTVPPPAPPAAPLVVKPAADPLDGRR